MKGTYKGDLNDDKEIVLGGMEQEYSWWKELQQRPGMKMVTVYLRGGKKGCVAGTEWARGKAYANRTWRPQ